MPQASYAQNAALIAGIRSPQSILASFESRPVWTEFAKSFDHDWEKYDKMQLAPMRRVGSQGVGQIEVFRAHRFLSVQWAGFYKPLHPFPLRGDLYPDGVGTHRRGP